MSCTAPSSSYTQSVEPTPQFSLHLHHPSLFIAMVGAGPQLQYRCMFEKSLSDWKLPPATAATGPPTEMTLIVFRCTAGDVTRILRPYVRDYFRRDGRIRDEVGILATSLSDSISIQASIISSVKGPTRGVACATFTVILQRNLPPCRGEAVHRFYRAYSERTWRTLVGT